MPPKPEAPLSEHGRFPYSALVDRPALRWPNGARVAIWVIPNIEHFRFDLPSTSLSQTTAKFIPDVLNYSWRDYGVRVGVWRLMDIMDRYHMPATAALNSDVCRIYPRIIEAGNQRGWEWMGHGTNNSTLLNGHSESDERALIADVLATIKEITGRRARGWLGPALTESHHTLDLLAECGIDYVADWVNDEQPYEIQVKSGKLASIPYSIEINDIPAFLYLNQDAESFARMICDQFDVLYEDGATTGRVMAIALHPFLVGHPYRSKHLAHAFAHITSRQDVWLATGSEIIDWYRRESSKH